MSRRICIFTGTRADYGLLTPLMKEIQSTSELVLLTLVSGGHLSPHFGMTYEQINADGFTIDAKVDIELTNDSPEEICKSMAIGLAGYCETLNQLRPDIVVILGDRYEAFTMATSATICKVPIAHIHGGETTQGAFDEAFRHSITKMSHFHFTSTLEHRTRVIQLGEQPENVYNVGALGTQVINEMKLLDKDELERKINFNIGNRYLLITYHPVTLDCLSAEKQFLNLLRALDRIQNIKLIFTKANADPGGRNINKLINQYVATSGKKAIAFTSMGQLLYLSAMILCFQFHYFYPWQGARGPCLVYLHINFYFATHHPNLRWLLST